MISKLFILQVTIPKSYCCFLFVCLGGGGLFIFHRHSKQEPASSRVTYFILRAYTGTGVSHSQHSKKKSGEVLEKNAGEWTGRVEIPGSKCGIYGHILTYSRL